MTNEMFKLLRLYSKMSMREFAKYIGVSKATVYSIEANKRPISKYVRGRLADKFDLTDDFLEYVRKYQKLSQR
ncbi:XRE family transcriptional regulator [Geobacillus sp. MR]|uniref:helix-turn-helix domain-containing protein n=1 Tax=Geobacillus sp. MR TaxID=2508875 RepID=UPI00148BBA0D|nr:helix-turn-helix transcriptional regulator [Geobacillus sp. MR]NNU88672.1 XRE family transcriptional regulator [Geobacillus sp. MR]